jgi:splicing factor 3B subunit 4
MRDPDTGNSRGFGFISYDSFEASDSAIEVWFGLVFEYVEMLCG